MAKTLLWWSHHPGQNYSRNRIVRQQIAALGWRITDFKPRISSLGDWQARFSALPPHDAVWVPCFRQRDVAAAQRHAHRLNVPLIFDPMISAWDKQVFERHKFSPDSGQARRLLAWESRLLGHCDRVVADTAEHAAFFNQQFGVSEQALAVVPVGAEEDLFASTPVPDTTPPEVLFVGSFIALQGPEVIVEAVRRHASPCWGCSAAARKPDASSPTRPTRRWLAAACWSPGKPLPGRAFRKIRKAASGAFRPGIPRCLPTPLHAAWRNPSSLASWVRPHAGPTTLFCPNSMYAPRWQNCSLAWHCIRMHGNTLDQGRQPAGDVLNLRVIGMDTP